MKYPLNWHHFTLRRGSVGILPTVLRPFCENPKGAPAKDLLTSSAVMASYTVGISFQIWQNINIQTIAREIRVSLFSVACIACC